MEADKEIFKNLAGDGSRREGKVLLCDVGNTSIKFSVADVRGLGALFTLPTRQDATRDSLGLDICALLRHEGALDGPIAVCVAASVCPAINTPLKEAVDRFLHCPCLFAPHDLPVPLENRYERPQEVGADRLVASWAARRIYPEAEGLIVVDFGTAVTFDCVRGNAYLGGLIFPGPRTSMNALAEHTAKLPQVNLDLADYELYPGRSTAESISQGMVFGYASLVEGLCGRLRKLLPEPVKILATGGFATAIGRIAPVFDIILPDLMLQGLAGLYFGTQPPLAGAPHLQRS